LVIKEHNMPTLYYQLQHTQREAQLMVYKF
jgi:hypothetical protein